MGHVNANSPLLFAKLGHSPAPTTLWIMDGQQRRVKAPKAKDHVYHLTIDEARAAHDIITSMYVSIFLLSHFSMLLYVYILLRYISSEFISCFSVV